MEYNRPLSVKRIRVIREALGYNIEEFSNRLDFSEYEVVENSNIDLPGILVAKLMQVFSVNPLWLYGESTMRFLNTTSNTSPKYITINESGEEDILLVNQKASAGYPQNIQDQDWYKELPSMKLPLSNYRNATYRGFQVEGDSMLPNISPGDWVIGRAVPSIRELSSGKVYIIVLQDAVVVKQVLVANNKSNTFLLRSTNMEYEDIIVSINEIQELWEVNSKLTFAMDVSKQNNLRKELQESMRNFTNR